MVSLISNMATPIPPYIGLDMDLVLRNMLIELGKFLVQTNGQPEPAIILVSVNHAPVGLGSFLGDEPRGPMGRVELKGGRIDCVVRFMLWGANPMAVSKTMLRLQADLLGGTQRLFGRGFLRLNALTSSNPAFDSTLNAWGRTADYSLLYEYRYEATDAAESLIVRIPVHADQESFNSPDRETTTITDEMTRWDQLAAPILRARGPVRVARLNSLVFAPTNPGGEIFLRRTFDGATGQPAVHDTVAEFLAALANDVTPQRHAQVKFDSYNDFLSQFSQAGTPVQMGNWNEDDTPDEYQGFELTLDPPVRLDNIFDRLELIYGNGREPLDQVAVIYLRFQQ